MGSQLDDLLQGAENDYRSAWVKMFTAADDLVKIKPAYEMATISGWGKGKLTGVPSFVDAVAVDLATIGRLRAPLARHRET
jgi:hypothetical protein